MDRDEEQILKHLIEGEVERSRQSGYTLSRIDLYRRLKQYHGIKLKDGDYELVDKLLKNAKDRARQRKHRARQKLRKYAERLRVGVRAIERWRDKGWIDLEQGMVKVSNIESFTMEYLTVRKAMIRPGYKDSDVIPEDSSDPLRV